MKTKLSATVAFISLFAMGAVTAQADPLPNTGGAAAIETIDARTDTQASSIFFTVEESELEPTRLQTMSVGTNYGNLDTFYGNLDTFYGNLDTFWGNLDTFYGNLDTFYGNLDTFYGNLDTFWGNLDTFYGNLDTFYGNLDTFYGNLDTFYGNLDTFYGNLDTFYGNLDTFWGNLDTFYGNLDTFYGNLDTFWGNLDTFEGKVDTFYGNLDTFYGNLDTFWGNLDTFWGNLDTFWGNLDTFEGNEADYNKVLEDFGTFYNMSQEMWFVPVAAQTGKDFYTGFAKAIFDKYGIDPTDASTLANLSDVDRAKFFVDWYDGLMQFSGVDRIDHWMDDINWTPALTQTQGSGADSIIGLLDSKVVNDADILDNVTQVGEVAGSSAVNGHGAGVASLMVAAHDGRGVMGIAPNASVVAYNPFDETNTAGWADVTQGIAELDRAGASVINMSLGVSGYTFHQDWKGVFADSYVQGTLNDTIFVKAAGNDGITQTEDVTWDLNDQPTLLIVGATGLDGEIAEWSNRPGTACLVDANGQCGEGDRLMDRFLVAPGEFMLVADDKGGVTRQSGTSFAAPLVSGAITLMHDRWQWLANHPEETATIILESARDLGAPGVDEVYGHGMLDVEAAQSPLDFNNLTYYVGRINGGGKVKTKGTSINKVIAGDKKWGSHDTFYYMFEYVGDTHRDFAIPFSEALIGSTLNVNGEEEMFQQYLYDRFVDWQTSQSFSDTQTVTAALPFGKDWNMSMTATPHAPGTQVREGELPFATSLEMRAPNNKAKLKFGSSTGALAIGAQGGFQLASDYDFETGGVNPFLGLASGGGYASAEFELSDKLGLNVGYTSRRDEHEYQDGRTGEYMPIVEGLDAYEAQAAVANVSYDLNDRVTVNVGYTMLTEGTGLLGVQALDPISLKGGATTDAATFGTEIALPMGVNLSGTATMGKTRNSDFGDGELRLADGATSTSWQLAVGKTALLGKRDKLRLSVAQPFHVEEGTMEFDSVQVVDRSTGEIGVVTQTFELQGGERPYVVEGIYAAPFGEMGEISAFARAELNRDLNQFTTEENEVIAGARLAFKF